MKYLEIRVMGEALEPFLNLSDSDSPRFAIRKYFIQGCKLQSRMQPVMFLHSEAHAEHSEANSGHFISWQIMTVITKLTSKKVMDRKITDVLIHKTTFLSSIFPILVLLSGIPVAVDASQASAIDGQRSPQKWPQIAQNSATRQDADHRREPHQRTKVSHGIFDLSKLNETIDQQQSI